MNGKFTRPSLIVIDGVSQPEVPSRLEPKGLINCLSGASHDPLGASSFIQPLELPPCRSVPLWKADRFNTDKAKQDALQMGKSRGDNHRAPHILSPTYDLVRGGSTILDFESTLPTGDRTEARPGAAWAAP